MEAVKNIQATPSRACWSAVKAGDSKAILRKLLRIQIIKEGIARNISFILILGALLAIAGVIYIMVHNEQRRDTKRLLADGTTLMEILAQAVAQPVAEGRVADLPELLRAIQDRRLAYGMVVDTDNRIMAHTDGRQRGRQFESPAASKTPAILGLTTIASEDPVRGQTIWHFSRPIETATRHVGTLRIGLIAASPSTVFWQSGETFGLIALIIFLLVPIVYYPLRALLRPLQQLNTRLEESITDKQFQALESPQRGEIGELVGHWNQTIMQLKELHEADRGENLEAELTINILSYEKRRLAMILDRLADGILITDSSDKIIFANKIAERFLNISIKDIIGKTLKECFYDDDMKKLLTFDEELKHNMTAKSVETKLDNTNNETFKASLFSIMDERESIRNMCLIIRNITQQKMAEKARSEFVASVSHELKTPLTTIKSYIELLINRLVENNEVQYEFYNTINDETDRMVRLINNLLNLSKIEMGSLQIKPTRVRMRQLLMDSFQAVESQALAKNIKFDLRLSEKLSPLEGDKDLLGTVVMNLLSNALKYTPEQGEVVLLADETEEDMFIHVRDTGIGIEETDLPHIFERFFRGQNGEKTQSGSGLGLALAQQITQLHGGAIKVVSQVNQGSQFTVTLPKNYQEQELMEVRG
jgi:two-component system phosphate regulon sensor histidine kinase PhoR